MLPQTVTSVSIVSFVRGIVKTRGYGPEGWGKENWGCLTLKECRPLAALPRQPGREGVHVD